MLDADWCLGFDVVTNLGLQAYTVHAVGGHKEQRLDEAGLMFYNSSCSIFHKNLKQWVTIAPNGRKGYVKGKGAR